MMVPYGAALIYRVQQIWENMRFFFEQQQALEREVTLGKAQIEKVLPKLEALSITQQELQQKLESLESMSQDTLRQLQGEIHLVIFLAVVLLACLIVGLIVVLMEQRKMQRQNELCVESLSTSLNAQHTALIGWLSLIESAANAPAAQPAQRRCGSKQEIHEEDSNKMDTCEGKDRKIPMPPTPTVSYTPERALCEQLSKFAREDEAHNQNWLIMLAGRSDVKSAAVREALVQQDDVVIRVNVNGDLCALQSGDALYIYPQKAYIQSGGRVFEGFVPGRPIMGIEEPARAGENAGGEWVVQKKGRVRA